LLTNIVFFQNYKWCLKKAPQLEEEIVQFLARAVELGITVDRHTTYSIEQHTNHSDDGMRYVKLLLEKQVRASLT
jgi:hypothetical protein